MYSSSAMTEMTATEARAGLPQILDRVEAGEEVAITRHGRVVAVVVRPDSLRVRRTSEANAILSSVRELMAQARRTPLSSIPGLSGARAEELVAEVRADRDSR
jgi:prevent-host-death family protein